MASLAALEADYWEGRGDFVADRSIRGPARRINFRDMAPNPSIRKLASSLIRSLGNCEGYDDAPITKIRKAAGREPESWPQERICWALLNVALAVIKKEDLDLALNSCTDKDYSRVYGCPISAWEVTFTLVSGAIGQGTDSSPSEILHLAELANNGHPLEWLIAHLRT